MARRKQILLGPYPPDPYAEPGYWQRINAERGEREAVDNSDVDWGEVREKYENGEDDDEIADFDG